MSDGDDPIMGALPANSGGFGSAPTPSRPEPTPFKDSELPGVIEDLQDADGEHRQCDRSCQHLAGLRRQYSRLAASLSELVALRQEKERLEGLYEAAATKGGELLARLDDAQQDAARWQAVRKAFIPTGHPIITPESADRYADALVASSAPPPPQEDGK